MRVRLKMLKKFFYISALCVGVNTVGHASLPIDSLIQQCANQTPIPIANAIIKTESSYNPFAIGVNLNGKSVGGFKQPTNYRDAVTVAKSLIANGKNIDMGLAQINSANLRRLNLSVEQVLEPCNNLKAMQYILSSCYASASDSGIGAKIQRAFSCYNTGNHRKGFSNGYVNKATKNLNAYIASSNNPIYNRNVNPVLPKDSMGLAEYANQINTVNNHYENSSVRNDNVDLVETGMATKDDSRVDVFSSKLQTGVF